MYRIRFLSSPAAALALALLLTSPVAAQPVIPAGFDLWTTAADGKTQIDFAEFPIPPGFFSEDSKSFTGVVRFRGEPLLTDPPGLLGNIDTIVERLTDAVPDGSPIPIRMRALRLRGIEPIRVRSSGGTSLWDVEAFLTGEQPQTVMRFLADTRHGGHWDAEIALNVRVSFVNSQTSERLTLDHGISLQSRGAKWQYFLLRSAENLDRSSLAQCTVGVDTDLDGATDSTMDGWCTSSVFIPVSADANEPTTRQAARYQGAFGSHSYVHAVAQDSDQTDYALAQAGVPPQFIVITIRVPVHQGQGVWHQVTFSIPVETPLLTPDQCPLFAPCNDGDLNTHNDRCIPAPNDPSLMVCVGVPVVSQE